MNTLLARTVLIISLGYAGFVVAAEEEEETKEDGPTFVQKNWSRLNNQFASGYPTERSYASYHWPDAVKEMQKNSSANRLIPAAVALTSPAVPQQSRSQRVIRVAVTGVRIASALLGLPF
jgi:hypothetical protein